MKTGFSKVEDAIRAIAEGRVVIVVDAEDRENEGDFIAAAEAITPEMVEFMITQGRGQLCVPIMPELADRLNLRPIVETNTAHHQTPFLVPIDHQDCQTGITATERALTIRKMFEPSSRPEEFVRPGHVFPLLAMKAGVLRRAGHTEAAVDLAQMAGFQPVGVLIEILDGTGRASREKLLEIAERFNLPIVTIEDLIRYRRNREVLVHREASPSLPTKYGDARVVAYRVDHELTTPIAVTFGDLSSVEAPLVRLHSSCFTGDLLSSLRCDCGDQLQIALKRISEEGVGALIYLPQEGRGIGLINKLKAYDLQDQGMDTVAANLALGLPADVRDYGIGLQILRDLGLTKVRLLTNNPKKVDAFVISGFGIDIVDQIPIIAPPDAHRASYLQTKRDQLGHLLPLEDLPMPSLPGDPQP